MIETPPVHGGYTPQAKTKVGPHVSVKFSAVKVFQHPRGLFVFYTRKLYSKNSNTTSSSMLKRKLFWCYSPGHSSCNPSQ